MKAELNRGPLSIIIQSCSRPQTSGFQDGKEGAKLDRQKHEVLQGEAIDVETS